MACVWSPYNQQYLLGGEGHGVERGGGGAGQGDEVGSGTHCLTVWNSVLCGNGLGLS